MAGMRHGGSRHHRCGGGGGDGPHRQVTVRCGGRCGVVPHPLSPAQQFGAGAKWLCHCASHSRAGRASRARARSRPRALDCAASLHSGPRLWTARREVTASALLLPLSSHVCLCSAERTCRLARAICPRRPWPACRRSRRGRHRWRPQGELPLPLTALTGPAHMSLTLGGAQDGGRHGTAARGVRGSGFERAAHLAPGQRANAQAQGALRVVACLPHQPAPCSGCPLTVLDGLGELHRARAARAERAPPRQ